MPTEGGKMSNPRNALPALGLFQIVKIQIELTIRIRKCCNNRIVDWVAILNATVQGDGDNERLLLLAKKRDQFKNQEML